MSEVEIYNNLNNSLIATGLFFIGWSFLVWVAGRAVTIAIENNAGIITTEKDYKKISQNLKEKINFLEIDINVKNEDKLVQFLKIKINEIN